MKWEIIKKVCLFFVIFLQFRISEECKGDVSLFQEEETVIDFKNVLTSKANYRWFTSLDQTYEYFQFSKIYKPEKKEEQKTKSKYQICLFEEILNSHMCSCRPFWGLSMLGKRIRDSGNFENRFWFSSILFSDLGATEIL